VPIYEYKCDNGHTFEVMQRMTDDTLTECTECGAPVQRVFHPVAIHFKGSGFYNTDYGTRRRSREMKEAAEGGSKDSSKSDSKSDSGSKSESSSKKSDSGSKKSEAGSGSKASSKSD
jgi:putative FmdB family regulatory protein